MQIGEKAGIRSRGGTGTRPSIVEQIRPKTEQLQAKEILRER